MKKQIKVMAVLSTAAFMTAVAPNMLSAAPASTAYAQSTGWTEENGDWYYYDSDGYKLTDTWKKQKSDWYYLNSDGQLELNAQVDEFYVGKDGKRVANQWVSIENEDSWGELHAPEYYWYYYGKDGKAVTSRFQSIENTWYYFNEDGQMQTGLIEVGGYTYYLGDENDGKMKTGWIQMPEDYDNPDTDDAWYYFDSNGRRVENQVDKKIDGAYYTFIDGRMQTGWVRTEDLLKTETAPETETAPDADASEEASTATASNAEQAQAPAEAADSVEKPVIAAYQYYDADGKRASGWRTIEGALEIGDYETNYTFYFKNGKPYYSENGLSLFTIDSKKYAFNTKGEMQTGLQSVNLSDGSTANFYFGSDGVMKTGKQVIFDEDLGQNQTWFFYTDGSRKGQGFHGVRENSVYINGLRQDADADLRYAPVTFGDNQYLVNTSGVIQKAGSSSKSSLLPELGSGHKDVKDANDTTWVVNTSGVIQNNTESM